MPKTPRRPSRNPTGVCSMEGCNNRCNSKTGWSPVKGVRFCNAEHDFYAFTRGVRLYNEDRPHTTLLKNNMVLVAYYEKPQEVDTDSDETQNSETEDDGGAQDDLQAKIQQYAWSIERHSVVCQGCKALKPTVWVNHDTCGEGTTKLASLCSACAACFKDKFAELPKDDLWQNADFPEFGPDIAEGEKLWTFIDTHFGEYWRMFYWSIEEKLLSIVPGY